MNEGRQDGCVDHEAGGAHGGERRESPELHSDWLTGRREARRVVLALLTDRQPKTHVLSNLDGA